MKEEIDRLIAELVRLTQRIEEIDRRVSNLADLIERYRQRV